MEEKTVSKAPPVKKHKRSSSGDLPPEELDKFSFALQGISDKIKDIGNSHADWSHLEELQLLTKQTDDMIQQVNSFKSIKKKDPNAVIISLSSVDEEILVNKLGVRPTLKVEAGSDPENFLTKIMGAFKANLASRFIKDIETAVSKWDPQPLIDTLKTIKGGVNIRSEATSRLIIDACLIQEMQVMQQVNPSFRAVLFPELLIWARQSDTDIPPKVLCGTQSIYLAGSVDYGLLSVLSTSELGSWDQDVVQKYVQRLINGENAVRSLRMLTPQDTVSYFEAKRPVKALADHSPQVIAEGLSIMDKLSNMSGFSADLRTLPFTLTSGNVWIFGTIDGAAKQCVRTTEIRLFAESDDVKTTSVRALMTLLLLWSLQTGVVIQGSLKEIL
ncbi:hypothetical protein H0H93_006183 [Arthromyces matolae]|nr:hypothetical protein H0H93_006183 [Arthromyces matolae]